jgi:predicted short-subunit dehydrogenase-like oxidoreductase (DUF2520 family)
LLSHGDGAKMGLSTPDGQQDVIAQLLAESLNGETISVDLEKTRILRHCAASCWSRPSVFWC